MKRPYLLLFVLILSLVLVTSLQFSCKACGKPQNYRNFISLVNSGKSDLIIDRNYDLRTETKKVLCFNKIKADGKIFYTGENSIFLERGQVIILPDNCVLLSEDCSRVLGTDFYEAKGGVRCYVAGIYRGSFKCPITRKIQLKSDKVLCFTTGSIRNAFIDLSGAIISAPSKKIFSNSLVFNFGNDSLHGKWFFDNSQYIKGDDLERLSNYQINFDNLNLYCTEEINVKNALWKNLSLSAPFINIGNKKETLSGIPISKSEIKFSHQIETNVDLSLYNGYIVLLSFGEHVHYDWREEKGRPTLFRGVASVLKNTNDKGFQIEDPVEGFKSSYLYTSSDGKDCIISSKGFIIKPCRVNIDSCNFYSTRRQSPGFMYISAGKDIVIRNSNWIASSEGTPSLLGVTNSVNGVIEKCSYSGAYYKGTNTSYGLQLFGSTRIKVSDCSFSRNRRGLDFSGDLCQSRYCIVENCKVVGNTIEEVVGSGIGGHSTSYRNSYINNTIEGSSTCTGIQTRGEYELIEGNVFNLSFSAAAITCVENTVIRNNKCQKPSTTFVWIESSSIPNNQILVENNSFSGGYLVRGQKHLTCEVVIRNNVFEYTSQNSSIAPVGDGVHVITDGNVLRKGKTNASLFFKFNHTLVEPMPERPSTADKIDFDVDKNGAIMTL